MRESRFEILDHTADVAVRAYGNTLPELFENAALAMFSVMVDLGTVPLPDQRTISVSAPTLEDLLVSWLRELIFLFETEHLVFAQFNVEQLTQPSDDSEGRLSGMARGAPYGAGVVRTGAAIKAATYHDLKVEQAPDGRWQVEITFDV